MKTRLSSDYLFHFTRSFETIKLILSNGFRHTLISEPRPNSPVASKQFLQQNFLVCFCDIKPVENDYHKECYGSFGLALTKQWGLKNRISPVRYVHSNSPGVDQNSIDLRNFTKGLFNFEHSFEGAADLNERVIKNIIAWSYWMDNRQVNTQIIDGQIHKEFEELIELLKPKNKEKVFKEFILKLRQRIADLFHTIETADPFLRSYKEDFNCPRTGQTIKDKILYDEREWRSCITTHTPDDVVIIESDKSLAIKGYLKEKHNLRFGDEDIVEIRLDKVELKDDLYRFLNETSVNLDTSLTMDKIRIS
jgi:hypothetical protein